MSIRDTAYQLCKAVWASPDYEEVHKLLWSLITFSEDTQGTEQDRSWYGYFQQNLAMQFLSYLLIDAKRSEIAMQTSLPMPQLPERELQILRTAHKALLELNRQCAGPLIVVHPVSARVIDPYNEYPLDLSGDTLPLTILPEEAVKAVSAGFHDHPAIAKAVETTNMIEHLSPDQYLGSALQMGKTLLAAGTQKAPSDIVELMIREAINSPVRRVARHMVSIISLRESLWVLNQLVFQAFISKKLPLLDQDNVIEIHSHSNSVARGHSIIYQPDDKARFLRPRELALLSGIAPQENENGLCVVDGSSLHHSSDTGTTINAELRVLDEDLNYYPILLEHL